MLEIPKQQKHFACNFRAMAKMLAGWLQFVVLENQAAMRICYEDGLWNGMKKN